MADTMTVYEPVDSDYGGGFSEAGTVMEPVLYVESTVLLRQGHVLESGSSGLVFVDAVNTANSAPITVGSKVVINGEELFCRKCTPLKTGDTTHHWEVEVG